MNTRGRASGDAATTSPNVRVDPANPDVVYAANTSTYRSTDGGRTFTAIKGAPGGDDYHTIWINPANPRHHPARRRPGRDDHRQRRRDLELLVQPADGADVPRHRRQPVSVLGLRRPAGKRIGGRRSAAATTAQITFRDWHPVGVEEYGYVAPDPLHPGIVYGGKVTRFDERTGRRAERRPGRRCATAQYRFVRTAPILFSPADPHVLFFATQRALQDDRTAAGSWDDDQPGPDARAARTCRRSLGVYARRGREGASTAASSTRSARRRSTSNVIWAGSDDGAVHVTRDGGADVDERHAARADVVEQGDADRRVALRRVDRVHLGLAVPARRPDAARLPHARRREDLDEDHARPRRPTRR